MSLAATLRKHRVLLLEASAGTGKTYSLETAVVELIGQGYRLEELLVVTFTERATAELLQRVRARLAVEAARLREEGAAQNPYEEALYDFDLAQISTIHGFCQRILSDYPFFVNTNLGDQVADGEVLLQEGFHQAVRRRLAVADPYRLLLEAWLAAWTLPQLQAALAVCRRQRVCPESEVGVEGWLALGEALAEPMHGTEDLERRLREGRWKTGAAKRTLVAEFVADLRQGRGSLPRFLRLYGDLKQERGLTGELEGALSEVPVAGRSLAEWLNDTDDFRGAVLSAFYPVVMEELEALKAREGLYDFEDMLLRVRDALRGPQGGLLVEALRRRYRAALIDEFQDTDDVQWEIFSKVFGGSREHLLFLVGDPKQAIYGFRGADVYAYLAAREQVREALGGVVQTLDACYRATPKLIAAWNLLFGAEGGTPFFQGGDIRSHGSVRPGRERRFTAADGRPMAPLCLFVPASPEGRLRRTEHLDEIAAEIARLRAAPPLMDGKPVSLRDIFVLARSHREVAAVKETLTAAGIPCVEYRERGLFQSPEAQDFLALLAAVADPHHRGLRVAAWATPFFAWSWEEVGAMRDAGPDHRAYRLLLRWHELAWARRYEELFSAIFQETGIVRRLLLLDESERSLTNYLHLAELLQAEAARRGWGIERLVSALQRWTRLAELPEGVDGDVQRVAGEEDAVQVMTMHVAKGLEAAVVFLFGGCGGKRNDERLWVYHRRRANGDWERCLLSGNPARGADPDTAEGRAALECRGEEERLFYVAVTRARGRVYLLDVPPARLRADAPYRPLAERLAFVRGRLLKEGLAEVRKMGAQPAPVREAAAGQWVPPPSAGFPPSPQDHAVLHAKAAPLRVTSYSRLKRGGGLRFTGPEEPAFEPEEMGTVVPSETDLPGGVAAGHFLHGVLEQLDYESARGRSLAEWRADPAVAECLQEGLRLWNLPPTAAEPAAELLHRALTSPLPLPDGRSLEALATLPRAETLREAEFVLVLPEGRATLLGPVPAAGFRVERGYAKGYLDLLFRHEGRVYLLDWKSDQLADYGPQALRAHMEEHYEIQVRLYTLAVSCALGLETERDYEERFGGVVYLFLRGFGPDGAGVYGLRPKWADLKGYEEWLRSLSPVAVAGGSRGE